MSVGNVEAGLKGMAGAFDAQKMAAEVITKTVDPNAGGQLKSAPSTNTASGHAVSGVGSKIDIQV